MELIDKDALVAELERLVSNGKLKCQKAQENNDHESYVAWSEHIATCGKILSFLDTLEVKEVNLEEEIKNYFDSQPIITRSKGVDYKLIPSGEDIAKYFFELGLKEEKENLIDRIKNYIDTHEYLVHYKDIDYIFNEIKKAIEKNEL